VANPTWPSTLPQAPYQNGPVMKPASNTIRSQTDSGAAKMRRRYTAVPVEVRFMLYLTDAEIAILETFVITTLKDVLPFDWVDLATNSGTATYRFLSRPSKEWYAGDIWRVTLEMEMLP
jgi:hypothetical protein